MKLVRSGGAAVEANGRAQDVAEMTRWVLVPILGEDLAREVANNAAMAFALDEDEIYEPDQSLAEAVREVLVQRLKHPKTYRAGHLTKEKIEEAVAAVEAMPSADESSDLGEAVANWFESPINEYKTPYVSHPEDFTPAEQGEFVDFVRQPRFVSRDEQIAKLREIIAARGGKIEKNGRMRGYCHVHASGRTTLHLPSGGRWAGGEEPVSVPPGTAPGWYSCNFWWAQKHRVSDLKRIDPAKEAARLGTLSEGSAIARTGSPGIAGFQERENASRAAVRAVRERQRRYAEILRRAAAKEQEEPIKPNRRRSSRASTLNGRSSMDTSRVGRDIDPDRYTGARGRALDAAMDRYETFHAKRPLRAVELPHDLPTQVVPIGQVISTMYRTDKWHEDGDDEDYKHVHDNSRGGKDTEYKFGKGVIAYEPAREAQKSVIVTDGKRAKAKPSAKAVRLPVHAPGALSLLGYCLGVFVQRFDDEEVYELNPRGCYLFCSPKGDMLAIYSPDKQPDGSVGFLMIMAGGGLRVLKDGIDG